MGGLPFHVNSAYDLIQKIISLNIELFGNVIYSKILFLYSFLILLLFISTIYFYKHKRIIFIIVTFLVIFSNLFFHFYNSDFHPPLRGLPVLLSGLFGIDSTSFRMQGLIPVFIFILWVLSQPLKTIDKLIYIFFIFTVPVLFFNTFIVEFSIWTFTIVSIFLIYIFNSDDLNQDDILKLGLGVILFSLIRQPVVLLLLIILALCFYYKYYQVLIKLSLLSIPTFLYRFKYPTSPASYNPEEKFLHFETNLSLFERLFESLFPSNLDYFFVNNGYLLTFFIFGIVYLISNNNFKLLFFYLIIFTLFWTLFHSIRPLLWGVPRYQLEYVLPFYAAFAFILIKNMNFVKLLVSVFILFNLYQIYSFSNNFQNLKIDYISYFQGKTPYLSESYIDFINTLKTSKTECSGNKIIFDGNIPTYSNFPLIFANYSVKDCYDSYRDSSLICTYTLSDYSVSFYKQFK